MIAIQRCIMQHINVFFVNHPSRETKRCLDGHRGTLVQTPLHDWRETLPRLLCKTFPNTTPSSLNQPKSTDCKHARSPLKTRRLVQTLLSFLLPISFLSHFCLACLEINNKKSRTAKGKNMLLRVQCKTVVNIITLPTHFRGIPSQLQQHLLLVWFPWNWIPFKDPFKP